MPGPRRAELNGLNWQVHVDPLTLSITSFPPTLPLLAAADEDEDELLDELPPQAASTMHTAANDTSQLKRFIDTLRFPSRRSPAGRWSRLDAARTGFPERATHDCSHLENT